MKTKHTFAFTFFLGLVWTGILFAYSTGPDPGVNGVFGPTVTCAQSGCHNTFALNSGTGSVSIGGLPATWTPGQTYTLTVTVSLAGSGRYGFQLSAVNNTTNLQAGTLLAASPNDSRVQIITGSGIQYAQHTSIFFSPGTPFSFRWTAPSNASFGAVRFNVAGNATNSDGNSTGDRIYTTSSVVSPAAAGDTTPPVISSVTSTGITTSAATITWTTDEASDTQVEFGTTTAYGQSTTLDTTLGTSHSASLTGLTSNTTYHYRVKSRDAALNLATGSDLTFTTLAPADTTPPVISAVTSSSITTSTATITWTTNEASDTQVEFGTTTAYGQSTTLNTTLGTAHSASLTGLTSNTTYHYRVKSRDAASNLATGSDLTFTTLAPADTTPPVISAVTSSSITASTATITWTTDEASDTQVEFGTTAAYGQSTTLNTTLGTAHSASLTGLASNTTYHYRVKSKDAASNLALGVDKTFITSFTVSNLGGVSRITDGTSQLTTGYGRILTTSGTTPSGVAIFGFRQNGILVTESGVPDSPLITSGRIYAEVSSDGKVLTGLAIANPNPTAATVTYTIRDTNGNITRSDSMTIAANRQTAGFLNEAPYLSGTGLQGTFSFTSTVPVAAIALRAFYNERGEPLYTTLPVLDLAAGASSGTQVISHFAAGEAWTTQIILVNPTGSPQTGTVQFLNDSGAATDVNIDGASGNNTAYTVAANSSKRFRIAGAVPGVASGSVRIVPTAGGPVPTPLVVFAFKPGSVTVSEAGVPVTMGTTFRMFAQLVSQAPKILTGVAIANATAVAGTVTLSFTDLSGVTTEVTRQLPAAGHLAGFIDELIVGLAGQTVQGVLRITTNLSSISVVGLRERYTTRAAPEDFLITTTPPTLENGASTTAERLFPHLVDGGDYTTQIILFSGTSGQTSGGTLSFVKPDGTPLDLNIK